MSGKPNTRRRARRKGSGVTMADVAAAAGVSMQTVSRALRHPDTVTAENHARINEAIRETHYVHNHAASHLASQKSNTVAVVIPTLSASVFAETVQHFSDVLHAEGYSIILGHSDYRLDREEQAIRSLLGRRPDGIFIIGTHHSRESGTLLRRAGIPVVEGWDLTARPIGKVVGFSNAEAIAAMTRHLAASGRSRIVFAGVLRKGDSRAAERRTDFATAMEALYPGKTPRETIARDLPMTMEAGATLFHRVMEDHTDADAIMFSSDILAAGALQQSQRMGIAVPGQLAMSGFGDFEFSRQLIPSLTTVAVPAAGIGREAARLLLDGMNGNAGGHETVDLGFELVLRESG